MSEIIDFKAAIEKKKQAEEPLPAPQLTLTDQDIQQFVFAFVHEFAEEVEDELGIDLSNPTETLYDAWVMIEAMKASIYRSLGVEHPFQMISEEVFNTFYPDENVEDFFEK